jgi:glycosyltransferase involved in cell wall biosynthesis
LEAKVDEAAARVRLGHGLVTNPAVSQIVFTYNHEPFVEQCLDSVAAQTFDDFELIIIDDCSTDRTVERIEAWLSKSPLEARLIVNGRNLGICATRNVALGVCRGEFLSTVSGDDYYEPDKIERQYRFWQELDGRAAAVFGNVRMIDESGREIGLVYPSGRPPADGRVFDRLIECGNFMTSPTMMTRRNVFETVGGYDESLFYEDYDMWLRLADRYEFRFLPGVLANYRTVSSGAARNPAYAAARCESRARVLLKWYGRSPGTDEVILNRAWKNGRRVLAADRSRGHRVLRAVCAARPTLRYRAGVALSAVPGAGHALAAAYAVADRARGRTR